MKRLILLVWVSCIALVASAQSKKAFKALVLYENGGHHLQFSKAALKWLHEQAHVHNFVLDEVQNTDKINDAFLNGYQLIIQLDYPPYRWKPAAAAAFEKYIDEGKGGWVGFHHATLLGDFDGYPMWNWFSTFMGGIKFKSYIADFADGQVKVEDQQHPVMKGLPSPFNIAKEEWYTYDKSPRPNVHVLATVNEDSYRPASKITMGDHPVVWTNPHYSARNVYIFMGHSPALLNNKAYRQLFLNAVLWAAGRR
ncbi:ThuA domain-containing protein [Mucilaginibacter daejeonensis]|uniref:ThuA domain-containing protein n=1 Tax=Mucilaginibacter daejeonensis TaxID=398049 RepID=UPI001D17B45A|nr:ThuA domain-containing protein [Mucilaginibacter daejeonensis]UEG54060.1 ThuA domain-containing protein [Mucilaginibacter daejeonensis]